MTNLITEARELIEALHAGVYDDEYIGTGAYLMLDELCDALEKAAKKNEELMRELSQLARESVERDVALAKLEAEVMQLWEAQRWVSVTERLPRQNTNVLTFTPKMAMPIVVDWYNGYYGEDDNEWYEGWNTGRNITHWLPLPAAPEKGAEK